MQRAVLAFCELAFPQKLGAQAFRSVLHVLYLLLMEFSLSRLTSSGIAIFNDAATVEMNKVLTHVV